MPTNTPVTVVATPPLHALVTDAVTGNGNDPALVGVPVTLTEFPLKAAAVKPGGRPESVALVAFVKVTDPV